MRERCPRATPWRIAAQGRDTGAPQARDAEQGPPLSEGVAPPGEGAEGDTGGIHVKPATGTVR